MNGTPTASALSYSFNTAPIVLAECIFGALANSLLLIIIIRDPMRNLRKRACLTIANLALADLISNIGGIGLCFYDYESRLDPANFWSVKSFYATVHIGFTASFLMLLLLSVEVYIVTKHPLTAHLVLTRRKTLFAISVLWFAAIIVASSNFWTEEYPFTVLSVVLCVFQICVMAVLVFRILVILNMRKNRRELSQLMPAGSQNDNGLTVTFLLLFVVFLVTAFPYLVAEQVHFLYHIKPEWNISFNHDVITYTIPLMHINYVINPLIYAYRMPDYRKGLIALFTCRKRAQVNTPRTPVSDKATSRTFTVNSASHDNSIQV
ncbi:adrenocorticotropic hormone receptor-like [Dendronephthya gigantea]|uniref:adrenocorticotropic hormone receptor-like n=1 Tax=Dendronephthya gigantea TaxID=151771 RepID=UPI0010691D12|nr:adrenocorticotropic hormone receptor-like [Dendronephthya gigantea]